jgi:hypothetical protein
MFRSIIVWCQILKRAWVLVSFDRQESKSERRIIWLESAILPKIAATFETIFSLIVKQVWASPKAMQNDMLLPIFCSY